MTILFIALGILVILMLRRPGVTTENLGLYVMSGFMYETTFTVLYSIVITAIHFIIFQDPTIQGHYNNSEWRMAEIIINGVMAVMPMIIAALMLGKSVGVGFIGTVALGYYTYYLAGM